MSEQAKKPDSNIDGVKYLYAENHRGKAVTLTVKSVEGGVEFVDNKTGQRSKGFDVHFVETPKVWGVVGVTVRRQLAAVMGTDATSEWTGKKVTLYPVESRKAPTGQAIRVKV